MDHGADILEGLTSHLPAASNATSQVQCTNILSCPVLTSQRKQDKERKRLKEKEREIMALE
jgi:hypothetical protein